MSHWTQTVIFICAVVSGVLNYEGLSSLVAEEDWWLKSLCAMTGVAVTLSLSLFWRYAFGIVPDLTNGVTRLNGWLTTIAGIMLIIALSTYWNVVSLTKSEIERLGGASIVATAEIRLSQSVRQINGFSTFVADISAFGRDVTLIQQREIKGGSSGKAGTGPVSNTMGQVADRLNTLVRAIGQSEAKLGQLQTQATTCLVDLRTSMNAGQSGKAGKALSCLNQTISQMAGQDVLSAMERGLTSLTSGIVLPATIRTKTQRETITRFLGDAQTRANEIAKGIAAKAAPEFPVPLTLERANIMKGVLLHWQSLIPPIATALALDLLPLIILIFKTLRSDDQIKRRLPRQMWTAEDMLDVLHQVKVLEDRMGSHRKNLDLPTYIDIEPEPHPKLEHDEKEPSSDIPAGDDSDEDDDTDDKGGGKS